MEGNKGVGMQWEQQGFDQQWLMFSVKRCNYPGRSRVSRLVINKTNELNIMVYEIKPHIIGITESWANNDISDAELGLEGYVMFRKDRMGRRGEECYYTSRKLHQHMKYS